jgi:hypothetical protein
MEFRVIWEIDIEADSPEQAVEGARALQLRPDMSATVFEVWDHAKQRTHRVDLAAPEGKLDNAELAAVRAAFRRLQCASDLELATKDMLTAMLIFLDAEEGYSRRPLK